MEERDLAVVLAGVVLIMAATTLPLAFGQQEAPAIEQPVDGPRGQYYTGKEYDA